MSPLGAARIGAWLLAAAGAVALVGTATWGVPAPRGVDAPQADARHLVPPRGGMAADSLRDAVVARDLFRPSRRPPARAFDPHAPGPSADATGPAHAVTAIRLVGVVLGERATAILAGLPDHPAPVVVSAGEVVGGWRVRAIQRHAVELVGPDTVLVVAIAEPRR